MADTEAPRCLKLAMVDYPIMMQILGSPPHVRFVGPVMTLLRLMADHFGFCYEYLDARSEKYGQLLDNGSWTGVMGMLQRGEVDMGGTIFSVTWRRWQAVDFSMALYLDQSNVMYMRPEVSSDMGGFIRPYTLLVWLMLFIASLVVFSATNLILRGEEALKTLTNSERGAPVVGWVEAAEQSSIYTWSTLMAQSVPRMPVGGSARLAVGMWLLISLILGTVYRSNLKALLIIPKLELPFDSMEGLAKSDLTTAVIEGSSMHLDILKANSNSTLGKLKDKMYLYPTDSQEQIVANTVQGLHAAFGPGLAVLGLLHLDYSRTGKCRMYMMSRGIQGPRSLSFGFPKGSPLTSRINFFLLKLMDCGILRKILLEAVYNSTQCLKPLNLLANPVRRSLQLKDFHGVISLYAAGIAVAFWSFAVEMVVVAKTSME